MTFTFKSQGLKSLGLLLLASFVLTAILLFFLSFYAQKHQKISTDLPQLEEVVDISSSSDSVLPPSSLAQYENVRRAYEARLANELTQMLERILGQGRAEVTVRADIDFSQQQTNREILDTDMPAVSSQKVGLGREETQYVFSKQNIHSIQNGGIIQKIRVAALIDESSLTSGMREKIETLLTQAAGLDEERGDTLEVVQASFNTVPSSSPLDKDWVRMAEFIFLSLVLILAFLVVVIKSFSPVRVEKEPVSDAQSLPAFVNPSVLTETVSSSQINGTVSENALAQAHELIDTHTDDAVTVLRGWLYQSASTEEAQNG